MYSRGTPRNVSLHGLSHTEQGLRFPMWPLAAFSRSSTMRSLFQIAASVESLALPTARSPKKSWVQGRTAPSQKMMSDAQRNVQGEYFRPLAPPRSRRLDPEADRQVGKDGRFFFVVPEDLPQPPVVFELGH